MLLPSAKRGGKGDLEARRGIEDNCKHEMHEITRKAFCGIILCVSVSLREIKNPVVQKPFVNICAYLCYNSTSVNIPIRVHEMTRKKICSLILCVSCGRKNTKIYKISVNICNSTYLFHIKTNFCSKFFLQFLLTKRYS